MSYLTTHFTIHVSFFLLGFFPQWPRWDSRSKTLNMVLLQSCTGFRGLVGDGEKIVNILSLNDHREQQGRELLTPSRGNRATHSFIELCITIDGTKTVLHLEVLLKSPEFK